MSEEKHEEKIKVTDKRKFDAEGNPREDRSRQQTEDTSNVNPVIDTGEKTEAKSSEKEKEQRRAAAAADAAADSSQAGEQMPPIDFPTFIFSLGTQALMSMGRIPGPDGKLPEADMQAAKQFIDILAMLREKTRGNLEASEITAFDNLLYDLRMQFIEASKSAGN